MLSYGPIWSKKGPKWSKVIQNCLKMVKFVSKWLEMVKFVKTVYYGPILSKTVKNGLKKF